MMDINTNLFQWFKIFLMKSLRVVPQNKSAVKNENMSNKDVAKELHKPIIRKFKKERYTHLIFIDNICGASLADMSKFNKEIRFLLCVVDIFCKYAWVISLKDKKGNTFTNASHKILDESNRKPSKIWVDKDSEFYNRSMKSWLQDTDIEIHSRNNEGKSFVAERFIRTFKNKIYKYMTSKIH